MSGQLGVASMTRKPLAAAFELDRDDVAVAVVMRAAGFAIDFDTDDLGAVEVAHHGSMDRSIMWEGPQCPD